MLKCPSCGQPIILRSAGVLSVLKQRIFNFVKDFPGISAEDLADRVYADDENGGPSTGRKTIHVHINHINKRLEELGSDLRINGNRWGGYYIISAEELPKQQPEEQPQRSKLRASRF